MSSKKEKKPSVLSLTSVAPRVLFLALPHKRMLFFGLLALALASGINLFFPYLIREILNENLGIRLQEDLSTIAFLLILLFSLQSVFFYIRHYCFHAAGFRLVATLRENLYNSIICQDISFFDTSRTGDLLSRLSSDTQLLQRAVTINISVVLRYLLQILGGTILMFLISKKLTALIVLLVPLIVLGSIFWGKRLRFFSRKMQNELAEASVIAEEAISSIQTVKMFAGDHYESKNYSQAIQSALSTGIKRTKIGALFSSSMVFLIHTGIACVIWYGGELILEEKLSVGDLTAFLLYCVMVAISLGFLVGAWDEFMQAIGAGERIFEILDSPLLVTSPEKPTPLPSNSGIAGGVLFDRVSFQYPTRPEITVLEDISFEIKPGSTVAIVGPSGAGKSTIASLIARFYDPTAGTVTYSGVPLKEANLIDLRHEMALVPQTPQIFSISIAANIRYGRLEATEKEVEEAAKAAHIHDFIESLPEKYETLVGDKGIQLSGGERQRIALARAILKDPRLLILDEATSALDSENERLVQRALERIMEGRTALVIAHRLSTVQHAENVIVLKDGRILQQGSHQSLLKEQGLYKTLVEYQLL